MWGGGSGGTNLILNCGNAPCTFLEMAMYDNLSSPGTPEDNCCRCKNRPSPPPRIIHPTPPVTRAPFPSPIRTSFRASSDDEGSASIAASFFLILSAAVFAISIMCCVRTTACYGSKDRSQLIAQRRQPQQQQNHASTTATSPQSRNDGSNPPARPAEAVPMATEIVPLGEEEDAIALGEGRDAVTVRSIHAVQVQD